MIAQSQAGSKGLLMHTRNLSQRQCSNSEGEGEKTPWNERNREKLREYSTNLKQGDGPEERQFALNRNIPEKSGKIFNARKTQVTPVLSVTTIIGPSRNCARDIHLTGDRRSPGFPPRFATAGVQPRHNGRIESLWIGTSRDQKPQARIKKNPPAKTARGVFDNLS